MVDEKELSIEKIKALIKEFGGYKKVAEEIGISESALTNSVSKKKVSNQTIKSLEMLVKIKELSEKTKVIDDLRKVILS